MHPIFALEEHPSRQEVSVRKIALMSSALLFVACSQTVPLSSTAEVHKQADSGTPMSGQTWTGGSFTDDFTFWGLNDALWERINNNNGSPFGCAFNPNNAYPDVAAQNSGKLNLRLDNNGTRCAEVKTRAREAAPNSTIGGNFNMDRVSGTVSSIFTFKRWDTGGGSWQEIDIELIPSWPGANNQPRLHPAIIYQASPTSDKYIYEGFLDVGSDFLNAASFPTMLFNWGTTSVQWKYNDQVIFTMNRTTNPSPVSFSYRENGYTVYVYRNNTKGGTLNVKWDHFPTDKTYIYMNYWRGDNTNGIDQFLGWYPSNNPSGTARYNKLFYVRW